MKVTSTGDPKVLLDEEKETYELQSDFTVSTAAHEIFIFIPKGFKTDLATVPECFWWWRWGKWNIAAIAHDFFYEHGYMITPQFNSGIMEYELKPMGINKKYADFLFYELMLSLEVNKIVAFLMHTAVKLFGRYDHKPLQRGKNNGL